MDSDLRPAKGSCKKLSSFPEHKDSELHKYEVAIGNDTGALTFEADFVYSGDDKVPSKPSTGRLKSFTNVSNEKLHEKFGESPSGGDSSHVSMSEIKAGCSFHTPAKTPGNTSPSPLFLGDSYLQDWESMKAALPETGFEYDAKAQNPPSTPKHNTAHLEPENIKLVHAASRRHRYKLDELPGSNYTGSPTPVHQRAQANLIEKSPKTAAGGCETFDNNAGNSSAFEGPQTPRKQIAASQGEQSPRLHKLVRSPGCWDLTKRISKAVKSQQPSPSGSNARPA
ncbi:hypothetical protein RUND412_002365 [Rhizina undulata]